MGLGIYLHLPFCASKCNYCSFFSAPADEATREKYLKSLIASVRLWPECTEQIDTVYFGGGTPSIFSPQQLGMVLDALKETFHFAENPECTMEANPDTITEKNLEGYRKNGLNRISFGVQSFWDKELSAVGRRHDSQQAVRAVMWAKNAGFEEISVDLMAGLPQQTLSSLKTSLQVAAGLPITHISAYLLHVEQGTPLYTLQNQINLPGEEQLADSYELMCETLPQMGFAQYEISNFAKPGHACRHNLHYWRREEYLAFGPSAHLFYGQQRLYYPSDLSLFETMVAMGKLPLLDENPKDTAKGRFVQPPVVLERFDKDRNVFSRSQWDELTRQENDRQAAAMSLESLEEELMLRLRLSEGVCLGNLERQYNRSLEKMRVALSPLERAGYLRFFNDTVCLTAKGFAVSNTVISELMLCLENL